MNSKEKKVKTTKEVEISNYTESQKSEDSIIKFPDTTQYTSREVKVKTVVFKLK
jgi:hypothetical protein